MNAPMAAARCLAAVALLAACGEGGAPGARPLATELHPVPTEGLTRPPPSAADGLPARARRRMDIDQLDAALLRVTGTAWIEGGQNQLTVLAATLGKPDFTTRTDEDLTMSPLFQKFLDDAARKVCADLMVAERARPAVDRRFFMHVGVDADADGDDLDRQLSALLLRFHGQRSTGGALDPWRTLFRQTVAVLDAPRAWSAVCVALITHPDFSTY